MTMLSAPQAKPKKQGFVLLIVLIFNALNLALLMGLLQQIHLEQQKLRYLQQQLAYVRLTTVYFA
jgi:hypothetical protein